LDKVEGLSPDSEFRPWRSDESPYVNQSSIVWKQFGPRTRCGLWGASDTDITCSGTCQAIVTEPYFVSARLFGTSFPGKERAEKPEMSKRSRDRPQDTQQPYPAYRCFPLKLVTVLIENLN